MMMVERVLIVETLWRRKLVLFLDWLSCVTDVTSLRMLQRTANLKNVQICTIYFDIYIWNLWCSKNKTKYKRYDFIMLVDRGFYRKIQWLAREYPTELRDSYDIVFSSESHKSGIEFFLNPIYHSKFFFVFYLCFEIKKRLGYLCNVEFHT